MNKRPLLLVWLIFWAGMLFSQPEQTPNEIFRQGVTASQAGNHELAVKLFSQAIGMDGNRYYFYYNRGMAQVALGNKPQAMADFKKSIDLRPSAEAYSQLGMLAFQQGNLTEAKSQFESAQQFRLTGNALFYLGLIYIKDKQFEEGSKCFKNCLDLNYNITEANYYKGYCEAKLGKHDDAMQSLLFATANNSKDWKYYHRMYEAYDALGEKQLALNNISMVIELGMRKPEYYAVRADLHKALGQDALAAEDLKTAAGLKDPALSEGERK